MLCEKLILRMTEFDKGEPELIQHFLKVYQFAHTIAVTEGLDEENLKILDVTSILHDIGIKPCMEKYGKCNGKMQEAEGPGYARKLLADEAEITGEELERICYLIAHHHSYEDIDGLDYRILLEADFLVNAFENSYDKKKIINFRDKVFKTESGIKLLNTMFDL